MCGDIAQAYVHNLGAMRTSLAMYSRLHDCARITRAKTCLPRPEATRFAYGLQTCGMMWRVYAMTTNDDGSSVGILPPFSRSQQPVTIIWSGCVTNPKDLTQATAILRQIGSEAKVRFEAVRSWLACICGARDPGPAAIIPPSKVSSNTTEPAILLGDDFRNVPKLPPGIPIPGLTASLSATPPNNSSPEIHLRNLSQGEASPDLTLLKPWVPSFLPRSASASSVTREQPATPSPRGKPFGVESSILLLPAQSNWPRRASTSNARASAIAHTHSPPAQIANTLHGDPHPLNIPSLSPPSYWQSQRTWNEPMAHSSLRHPTPKLFQYSASYNYSWPALPTQVAKDPRHDRQAHCVWAAAPRKSSITISHPGSKAPRHSRQGSIESCCSESRKSCGSWSNEQCGSL